MPLTPCVQVVFIGHGPSGEQLVNTLHLQTPAGTAAAYTATTLEDYLTAIQSTFLACCTVQYTWDKATIKGAGPGSWSVFESFTGAGNVGTNAGGPTSIERSIVLLKNTLFSGRKFHGRIFMPCPSAAMADDEGRVDPAAGPLAAHRALATAIASLYTLDGTDWIPSIYHRVGNTFTGVSSMAISTLVGIQRRRRYGIGA